MFIQRFGTTVRMSQAVAFGQTIYLAGQVSQADGVAAQTREILANIDALLARSGSDSSRLLSATLWLADIADYDAVNEIWDAWVPTGTAPVRACVESRLAGDAFRVEIGVIAAVKEE
ncbi:enamine deaminase RidA (YjgF/YER057c/UK114 family) [Caulobacter ginsengisoli]|uniref:Enamine deaminase RidA (YjgF/YER057c/UK114 family) n=1 Tax=Caulobacter ginsengisoli TaxID=400775 RepID=A0ABU0IV97_9CAUL|nr:RidA family protein [Caulobacter ginsengisoli]MDQ0465300.1 enamine deaminase RidA (YjgF/YER057c/UK114 family) [Caulobacter ginsengisoli]